jgi:hypothetical protein
MADDISKAKLWRDRGDQLRAIAGAQKSAAAREDLLHLAGLWEKLARFAEGGALPFGRAKVRAKAESLRVEARSVLFPATRSRMLAVAEQYDLLNETLENEDHRGG